MQIRKLSPIDAPQVAALWHEGTTASGTVDASFLPRPSISEYAESTRTALDSGSVFGWCVVGEDQRSLVGYLTAEVVPRSKEWQMEPYLHVLDVDVKSTARQQGHATRLLQAAVSYARSIGLARVELSWLVRDPRSSAVWTKLGFQPYLCRGFLAVQAEPTDGDNESG
jgi:ribosomal protein S18 acetylase RimI-like enzyme